MSADRQIVAGQEKNRPRVVIVGAGFSGLWAARALAAAPVEVWLLDRNNYHIFQPLLYQVAAAELEPEEIAYPVRSVLHGFPNAKFVLAEVTRVDFTARRVETDRAVFPYDFLILATGSEPQFFHVAGAGEQAFQLKTLEDGMALRSQILACFERAAHEPATDRRQRLLTFTIVGGGPTGVEFAGALAELIRGPLCRDFPELDCREVRVVLLEAAAELLPTLPPSLRTYARRRLRTMNVELHLGTAVREVTREAIQLADGTVIPTETVVWTAGVRGDRKAQFWGLPTTRNGRVTVQPTLQLPQHPEVYVAGDLAEIVGGAGRLPMLAPVAIQQGMAAARNIRRQIAGHTPQPFTYRDRGTMVTIGRNAAVAWIGRRCVTGYCAWVLWLAIHLYHLIGVRNRLFVLINWAWDYVFFERAVRLILPARMPRESNVKKGENHARLQTV